MLKEGTLEKRFENMIATTNMMLFWKEAAEDYVAEILFVSKFVLLLEIFNLKIYCICPPIDLILFSFLQWTFQESVWSTLLRF